MSQDYRKLEADILALLVCLQDVLTKEEAQEVRTFIDVGEYGVAFETLCSIIKEEQKSISELAVGHIGHLAQQMNIDGDYWRDIVERQPG